MTNTTRKEIQDKMGQKYKLQIVAPNRKPGPAPRSYTFIQFIKLPVTKKKPWNWHGVCI